MCFRLANTVQVQLSVSEFKDGCEPLESDPYSRLLAALNNVRRGDYNEVRESLEFSFVAATHPNLGSTEVS